MTQSIMILTVTPLTGVVLITGSLIEYEVK
jgi:hypothetical protein